MTDLPKRYIILQLEEDLRTCVIPRRGEHISSRMPETNGDAHGNGLEDVWLEIICLLPGAVWHINSCQWQ
jgi:hypothetical protein